MFAKFQPLDTDLINPNDMLSVLKLHNMQKTLPSMYSMVEWIVQAREKEGKIQGMTFDEMMNYSIFFFNHRSKDEGLKYIFELFDT